MLSGLTLGMAARQVLINRAQNRLRTEHEVGCVLTLIEAPVIGGKIRIDLHRFFKAGKTGSVHGRRSDAPKNTAFPRGSYRNRPMDLKLREKIMRLFFPTPGENSRAGSVSQ